MFPSVIFLVGIDSSHLGKVNKDSLPQQAVMELLISGIVNREKICGSKEEPKDISAWQGVKLNENEEVMQIRWFQCGIAGTINLDWLPSTVRKVDICGNYLTGSIDLETLPPSVKYLYLNYNKFSGEIDLTHLPEGLEDLSLSRNQLSGPVDLTKLPAGLQKLYLSENNFSGETDFSQLPKFLEDLFVSHTQFSGEIHLERENRWFKVENSNVKIVINKSQA